MFHGGGWFSFIRSGDEKPQKVTKELLQRVLTYARPYWGHIGGMLVTITLTSTLALVSPLIFRALIDKVLEPSDSHVQLGLIIHHLCLYLDLTPRHR